MSNVAHQYSRVGYYSSVEVNLSLYYGGVPSHQANDLHRMLLQPCKGHDTRLIGASFEHGKNGVE